MWRIVGWLIAPFLLLLFRWRRLSGTARILGIIWTIGIAIIIISTVQSIPQDSGGAGGTPASDQYDIKLIFPVDRYPETADHIQDAIAKGESPICTIDRSDSDAHRDASLAGIPTKKGYDRDEWPMAMCAEGGGGADIRYVTPSDNRGAGSWIGGQLDDYTNGTRVWIVIDNAEAASEVDSKLDAVAHSDANSLTESNKAAISIVGTDVGAVAGAGTKSTTDSGANVSGKTNSESTSETSTKVKSPVETNASSEATSGVTPNDTKTAVVYKNCTDVRAAGAAPLHEEDPGYSRKLDRDGDGVACE